MGAVILPSEEDLVVDPERSRQTLDAAKRELFSRPADFNEATLDVVELNEDTIEAERHAAREARQQAKAAEAAHEREAPAAVQQDTSVTADRGESRADSGTALKSEYRADPQFARDQLELLSTLTALRHDERQRSPLSAASDETDDTEFFRSPREAVARAVANHPALAALQTAARETYEKKLTAEFVKEFPEAEQTMQDAAFREWASASPIRMELLKAAHAYDLDAARHIFSTWRALRGGEANAKSRAKASGGKTRIFRRADVIRLMTERPDEYEKLEPEIARAYAAGRVK